MTPPPLSKFLILTQSVEATVSPQKEVVGSLGDQRSYILSEHRTADIAFFEQVEHNDRKMIVHAQTDGGRVHNLKPFLKDFHVP